MKLLQGDCLELMKDIPDGSVDCVITDPPYSFPTAQFRPEARIKQRTFGDFSTYQHFFRAFMQETLRVLKKDGDVFCFCDEVFYPVLFPIFYENFYATKMLVWDKERIGMGGIWRRQMEIVIHAYLEPKKEKSGDGDIIRCKPVRDKLHNSQKPVELIERFLKKTQPTMVLDPFMGSGSTGVACKNLGIDFIGMEISEDVFALAKQRIETAQQPLFAKPSSTSSTSASDLS